MKRIASLLAALALACGMPAHAAQIRIITPTQDAVVHDNGGTVAVSVTVEPAVQADRGQALRLLLDGQPASPDTQGTSFTVMGVERGEHWLQVVMVDGKGQTLAVSQTVNFTMWQASTNAPPRKKQ